MAPLGAALCAILAFERYVSGARYFLTIGSIAVAGALGSAALSLLAAGWMLEAGSSGVGDMYSNAQDAWYVSTANKAATLYAVAMIIAFAAGIVSLISVLRHRVAPGPVDGAGWLTRSPAYPVTAVTAENYLMTVWPLPAETERFVLISRCWTIAGRGCGKSLPWGWSPSWSACAGGEG